MPAPSRGRQPLGLREPRYPQDVDGAATSRNQRLSRPQDLSRPRCAGAITPNVGWSSRQLRSRGRWTLGVGRRAPAATMRSRVLRADTSHILAVTVVALVGSMASAAGAQARSATPAAYVREIRVDPILLSFGMDSAKLRQAVVDVLRRARHSADCSATGPALDVALTVPRTLSGTEPDPRALLHVEVGRNLMEAGRAESLVWERSVSTPRYATWRALVATLEMQVLNAVRAYVLPQ